MYPNTITLRRFPILAFLMAISILSLTLGPLLHAHI